MRTHTINAIVIRRTDLAEKDRILTLFSKESGRISAVAKGARRPGSRLGGASEPFTYSKMLISTGRDLDIIAQAEIIESFPNVKQNIDAVSYGIYMLELIGNFIDSEQANAQLFDNLLSAMYILESGTDPKLTTRYFELNMLDVLGYKPHFDVCLRCAGPIGIEKAVFSPSMGGMICKECGMPPNDAIWVSGAITSYFKALEETQPHKIKDLHFPKGAMQDLEKTLKWHIKYRLERKLKSSDVIDAILQKG